MAQDSTAKRSRKAGKRQAKLWVHSGTNRWCKKLRGKFWYFGNADKVTADDALHSYLEFRKLVDLGNDADDAYRQVMRPGNDTPDTPKADEAPAQVRDVVNEFMAAKAAKLATGELSQRTHHNYFKICDRIVAEFGARTPVEKLGPADFAAFRAKLARTESGRAKSLYTIRNDVRDTRIVFRWAAENDVIDRPVKFGTDFRPPGKTDLRKQRQKQTQKNGRRMFDASNIRQLVKAASPCLRAMILLAINCGYGNTDVASLPISALNLKRRWIDFPRPKTGVERSCPLWPETIKALKAVIGNRKDGLVFLTKYNQPWVRVGESGGITDSVAAEFAKLLRRLKLKRDGLNFYGLRHSHQTVGENETRDVIAVKALMGHIDSEMSEAYREYVGDDRIRAVVNAIRKWVWPAATSAVTA